VLAALDVLEVATLRALRTTRVLIGMVNASRPGDESIERWASSERLRAFIAALDVFHYTVDQIGNAAHGQTRRAKCTNS
jgi:hypothetical protein